MEGLLTTLAVLVVIGLALVLLSRTWVRSSRLGGYRATHRPDGRESDAQVPEDDDVHWNWGDDKPEP
jgi:hypothetical protein